MWSMWQPCMTTAYLVGTFMIETTVLLLCHLWSNNLPRDQSVQEGGRELFNLFHHSYWEECVEHT